MKTHVLYSNKTNQWKNLQRDGKFILCHQFDRPVTHFSPSHDSSTDEITKSISQPTPLTQISFPKSFHSKLLKRPVASSSVSSMERDLMLLQRYQQVLRSKSSTQPDFFLLKPMIVQTRSWSTVSLLELPMMRIGNNSKRKWNDETKQDDLFSGMKIKRPKVLDMKKVRSLVLGEAETSDTSNDDRAFSLPTLTSNEYSMEPRIEELTSMFNEKGECWLKTFTVTRKHYGSVTFQGSKMNVAGLDLNRLSK